MREVQFVILRRLIFKSKKRCPHAKKMKKHLELIQEFERLFICTWWYTSSAEKFS